MRAVMKYAKANGDATKPICTGLKWNYMKGHEISSCEVQKLSKTNF